MSLLNDLNPVQKKALGETGARQGPLFVFVGPASGKTRLPSGKRPYSGNISSAIFTGKAANEMKENGSKRNLDLHLSISLCSH